MLALLLVLAMLAGCGSRAARPPAPMSTGSPTSTAPTNTLSPGSGTPTEPGAQHTAEIEAAQARARADVVRVVKEVPDGAAAVSAVNLSTGARYTGGSARAIWTASIYKLLVLETLLIQHGPLDDGELDEATKMIENSNNKAGWALWEAAGGNSGLSATLRALHMTHSVADGTDPTFTRITASDALRLVRVLVGKGPLSAAARRQALTLMRNVEADQRWGVGVVADKGTDVASKNGWLSVDSSNPAGEDDGGRWVVDSVGIVRVHGQQVLMAAMSEHNASLADGIAIIQALAKDAAVLVAPAR